MCKIISKLGDLQNKKSFFSKDKKRALSVDQETCIGCNICAVLSEKHFEMTGTNSYGGVTSIPTNFPEDKKEEVFLKKDVLPACPTDSISIDEMN